MIENPGLSYGLFHAVAQPIYSWGVIRKVSFPGVNMDIGHIRMMSWSKDNDRNTWIGYNKLRGQYLSALEHAIPERFFNDPQKCNAPGATGTTPVAGLPDCPQAISAVKAIALATAQGQKIYTITQEVYRNNPNIVNANLSAHSSSTKQAVQNALDTGQEVTIHEAPITQSGWTGAGYTQIDPQTGAGGYIIDGGTNGSFKEKLESDVGGKLLVFFNTEKPPEAFYANPFVVTISFANLAVYSAIDTVQELWNCHGQQIGDAVLTILLFLAAAVILAALTAGAGLGAALTSALLILAGTKAANAAPQNRSTCGPAKMRVQFQVSLYCNNPGGDAVNTIGGVVEQLNRSLGVTKLQVREKMAEMFAIKPSWVLNGVNLVGMIVYISQRLDRYPPIGVEGRRDVERAEQFYKGLCYRVDIENFVGRNLKE
jgi:hypothetical protein